MREAWSPSPLQDDRLAQLREPSDSSLTLKKQKPGGGPGFYLLPRTAETARPILGDAMSMIATIGPESNGLWDYKQLAAYLCCSVSTVKRLPIPHIRIGRLVRFETEQVLAWVRANAVPRRRGGTNG